MKLVASLFIPFAIMAPSALAGPSKCQEQCNTDGFTGVDAQLQQVLNGNGANALNAFKYGRYCGASNFNMVGDVEPCNPIDKACQGHDLCYAEGGVSTDDGPTPNRCECNGGSPTSFIPSLVASLFACDEGAGDELCTGSVCDYNTVAIETICLFCFLHMSDHELSCGATDEDPYPVTDVGLQICNGSFFYSPLGNDFPEVFKLGFDIYSDDTSNLCYLGPK